MLAATTPEAAFRSILPWALVLIGLAIIGAVVILSVRRMMKSDFGRSAEGFTLQDLRDMRAQGQLSEEEFQAARAAMIGRVADTKDAARAGESKPQQSGATAPGGLTDESAGGGESSGASDIGSGVDDDSDANEGRGGRS